jgi:protein-export membrane protein SecD
VRRTRGLWASVAFMVLLVVGSILGTATGGLRPQLGLDLEGGVAAILSAPSDTPADVMERALENIRRRVDAFGVGEPDIFLSGNTIEVQIPGAAESTVTRRSADLWCLVGAEGENYGCAEGEGVAEDALADLEVEPRPTEVCLVTAEGDELDCYASRSEAQVARTGITVVAAGGGAGPPRPGGAPPPPAPDSYCLTDLAGTQLACFDERRQADAALDGLETEVTSQEFCVSAPLVAPPSPSAQPPGTATPSPSPSPFPSAFSQLEEASDVLPCVATETEADDARRAVSVGSVPQRFCVIGSAGDELGCFLDRERALELQRETGSQQLLDQIGKTARLEERQVLNVSVEGDPGFSALQVTCATAEEQATDACSADALATQEVVYEGTFPTDGPDVTARYQLGPVIISGVDIDRATATLSTGASSAQLVPEWSVAFDLSGEGSNRFATATTAALTQPPPRNQIAIVVDREVISSPEVQGAITGGSGEISGSFTEDEARELATQLNAGSLPVELTRQSVRTVSPTLGTESLRQGIVAGVVGLVLLFLYLLFYYRLLGVVAWFGMSIWAALALALVSIAGDQFGYALTLAGVAGLVISLGVTADSYIVFFERLKDEVRSGRSPRTAVQPAFKRAFRTIVAADIVAVIAAGVLYVTAVSSVRGFALTLGVATLLDLFVVYFFKRPTMFLIARNNRLVRLRGFGLESGVAADHIEREVT